MINHLKNKSKLLTSLDLIKKFNKINLNSVNLILNINILNIPKSNPHPNLSSWIKKIKIISKYPLIIFIHPNNPVLSKSISVMITVSINISQKVQRERMLQIKNN